jgi:hypothetical protein
MWREASALLAATKMRAAVAELTATWCKHALISASASASPMAKLGPQRFAAIGAAPDLASRLCDEAKDAQILIDAKVRAAVELICELDPLAELRLKVSPPD